MARRFEVRFEVIELGDQLVDPFRHVLAALVRGEHLLLQLLDPPLAVLDACPQLRVLADQALMAFQQGVDRALETFEVARAPGLVARGTGNGRTSSDGPDRTDRRRFPSSSFGIPRAIQTYALRDCRRDSPRR